MQAQGTWLSAIRLEKPPAIIALASSSQKMTAIQKNLNFFFVLFFLIILTKYSAKNTDCMPKDWQEILQLGMQQSTLGLAVGKL